MNLVHRVFYGPSELRAGWRLLIFFVFFIIASLVVVILSSPLGGHLNTVESRRIVGTLASLIPLLAAGVLMAKFEERRMADYGLPWRRSLGRQFWQGVLLGFPTITALVAGLHLAGSISFTEGAP
jgi:hypothetical protein